jgi:hypothetical protein
MRAAPRTPWRGWDATPPSQWPRRSACRACLAGGAGAWTQRVAPCQVRGWLWGHRGGKCARSALLPRRDLHQEWQYAEPRLAARTHAANAPRSCARSTFPNWFQARSASRGGRAQAACARSTGDLLAEAQEELVCGACLRGAESSRPLAHCLLAGFPLLFHHCRRVFVKTLKDVTFIVDCDASSTVVELKHRVAEQDASWDVQRQRCPSAQSNPL